MSGNRDFIIRTNDGPARFSGVLVVGRGMRVAETADGLPELVGVQDDVVLEPSGNDDAAALNAALERHRRVRLTAGTFLLGATVTVPGGRRLVGDGPGRTVLRATHDADVLSLSGTPIGRTTVEGVTIVGTRAAGQTGIRAVAGPPAVVLTLRGVGVHECGEHGVHLQGSARVIVSDLSVFLCDGAGLFLADVIHAECGMVSVSGGSGTHGLHVLRGYGQHFAALQLDECVVGIEVQNASGIVVDGAQSNFCESGILLGASRDVVLNGCRVLNTSDPSLSIGGGGNHVINGFVSDRRNAFGGFAAPHVLVTGSPGAPAAEITFVGCRKVNSNLATPTYEVDVSSAGARVVFLQHNFDPARINSGGNFASL